MEISSMFEIKVFRWYHCILIYIIANAISLLPAGYNGDEVFYNSFIQPAVAPADWIFAPMWFILNVTSLIGLYFIMNGNYDEAFKKSIYSLEIIGWILYALFSLLYFGLKSPILGALDTALGLIAVVLVCLKTFKSAKVPFYLFLLRLLWLVLATYVSVWVALKNTDSFLNL
jgi:translocator protein